MTSQQHSSLGSATPNTMAKSPTGAGGPSDSLDAKSPLSASGAAAANKAHLSDAQKKANHIASEKKRRNNIREQYDKLAAMVPGMEGQGRSEGRVLEEVVRMSRELITEREQMIREIEVKGGKVDADLKAVLPHGGLSQEK